MALRARPFFHGLCRLQIGAEVPCAFDDPVADREPFGFEPVQTRFDIIPIKRLRQSRGIVRSLRNPGTDMGARDEGSIADDGDMAKGKPWAFQIVDRLQ